MPARRRRSRGRRTGKITPLHWLNLGLFILTLCLILFFAGRMGQGTAGCFARVSNQEPTSNKSDSTDGIPRHKNESPPNKTEQTPRSKAAE